MTILADKQISALCTGFHYVMKFIDLKNQKVSYTNYPNELDLVNKFVFISKNQMKEIISDLKEKFEVNKKNASYTFNVSNPTTSVGLYTLSMVSNEMVVPYIGHSVKINDAGKRIPSFGQSSYGYDVRTARNYKRLPIIEGALAAFTDIVDTIDFVDQMEEVLDVDYIDIPPHGFVLGTTVEKFDLPHDTMVIFTGKSTLARMGLSIFCTPAEPGWSGYITTEIFNATPRTVRLHSGIGLMQAIFFKGSEHCEVNYSDRGGKYNNQIAMPV
ncbi:MAG: dCTP deaminase, partial [Bacteroidia bacterium]